MQTNNAQYVVIFTSILNPDAEAYHQWGKQMESLVVQQPGYISHKSFRNPEGLGVTLSYWESLEAIRLWHTNTQHQQAQAYGKKKAYLEYTIEVCEIKRAYSFPN